MGDGSDDFIIIDFKPTESLAVDPTNPNADLLATPGPDDNAGYDWPGEYAQRFDGVDPAQPDGGTGKVFEIQAWDWEVKVDPNTLTSDVTDQSVEVLGQPAIETLEIAHEGFLH